MVITMDNKMKSTKNNKKHDGSFRSKNVKHNPAAESARAVFGLSNAKPDSNNEEKF